MPEGFHLAQGSAQGLARVFILAWQCGNTTELWAGFSVIPPASYANDSVGVDAVLLQAFTTNATDIALYDSWGVGPLMILADGQAHESYPAGAAQVDRIAVSGSGHSYDITTTIANQPSTFPADAYRFWTTNGTKATGYTLSQHAEAPTLGEGSARFQQTGDPAAPPLTGGLAHRVDEGKLVNRWVKASV